MRTFFRLLATCIATALAASNVAARQAPTLQEVESLMASGRYDEARAALDRLLGAGADTDAAAPLAGEARVQALLLRGRLAVDPEAAEADYLAVALGYPTAPGAAEALLRIGQGALARGDAQRAIGYLERLVRDYPTAAQHAPGLVWLARAQRALGNESLGCATLSRARDAARGDTELIALIRDLSFTCPAGGGATGPAVTAPANATPSGVVGPSGANAPTDVVFTIQVGAFSSGDAADRFAAELRDKGFDARVVLLPGSDLVRVRSGRYAAAADAAREADLLRIAGFDGFVVDDTHLEQPYPGAGPVSY